VGRCIFPDAVVVSRLFTIEIMLHSESRSFAFCDWSTGRL